MIRLTAYLLSVLDFPDMIAPLIDLLSVEISWRKYQITASSVPRCTEVSNANPWSGQSNIRDGRIRWAELEMGRNSVMPWIRARETACRRSKI